MKSFSFSIGTGLFLAIQLLLSTSSFAADYYVHANVGSNEANSGLAPDDAFADIKYAVKQLAPGDTLHVRTGTYSQGIFFNLTSGNYNSGTSTNPITVKGYQNEIPVIGAGAGYTIVDLSWWVFDGLVFEDSARIGIGRRDDNATQGANQCSSLAENITIQNTRFQHGSKHAITITCGNHIVINNNVFDNLRSRTSGIDTQAVVLTDYANDIVISDNQFSDIGADGVHLLNNPGAQFSNIEITNNVFEIQRPYRYRDESGNVVADTQSFDNVGENAIDIKQGPGPIIVSKNRIHGFRPSLPGQDASGSNGAGIIIHSNARGIILSKNRFYDNAKHLSVAKNGTNNTRPDRDLMVLNNIFEDTADLSDYVNQAPTMLQINSVSNVSVLNNTFRNQPGEQELLLTLENLDTFVIKNNALQNGVVKTDGSVGVNANYNAWSGVSGYLYPYNIDSTLVGINDVTTDNLGIDLATLAPLTESPLIDAAQDLGVTDDFNSAPVSGLRRDIGAVEYQNITSDTEAPAVTITNPTEGATLSGTAQVTVAASDNVGVTKVNLLIDGTLVGTDLTAPYTFTWDSSSHANGSTVALLVRAFDAAGNNRSHAVSVTVDNQVTVPDTTPPAISVPSNKTREATGQFTSVSLGTASATDDVDGIVAVTPNNTGPFSVSAHLITWTATDSAGNTATATQTITVVDTTRPAVTAPNNVTVQSTGNLTEVQLGSASTVDLVDGSLVASPSTTGPFTVGTHSVIWRATDTAGNTGTDTQVVTITEQVDTTPPTITPPADLTVGATGVLTEIDLGQANAYDDVSGALTPIADNPGPFASGLHQILWRATDAAGNTAEAVQYLTVLPQANFSVDQTVSEGSNVTVTVLLSGEAPVYPVTVPYVVTGTATNPADHNATDGVVVISSGTTGVVSFQTVDDGVNGEPANTVVFEMQAPTNAVPGTSATHTATILETNLGPLVDFSVSQSGAPTRTVYAYDGPVVVSANVRDPNPDDTHDYDWSATDNRLFSDTGLNAAAFSFDPQFLEPGLYKLNVAVMDNGVPAEGTSAEVVLNVVMERPVLSNLADQDHDGLSDAAEGTADTEQDGIPDYLDNIENPAVLQGISGVSDHHLLVAEAGVQLQLGATALAAGQASALVTLADITNFGGIDGGAGVTSKRSSDFPGGLYDFVITGLSEAGQSVQIVLPQFLPLPKAAVYRKYIPGVGWQNFVTNGVNKIASAPGSDGVCPAPGDSSYRNGLHAGDYCIQLTIVDGGPNDTDGIPNGVIRDPGGAEIDSQASGADSSGRGGCTINTSAKMDPIWLFLMLVSAAGFIRKRLH